MRRVLLFGLAALALPAFGQEPGARIADPIRVDGGLIKGGEESPMGGVRVWRGIPYATPPVGPLRWKPPQPLEPWQGAFPCEEFGPGCPQPPTALPIPLQVRNRSENCLRLNVWTPAKRVTDGLPVLVWVHGTCGGFARGSAGEAAYEGELLASRGVVVVTFNYRLGVFGWMAHPALSKESAGGVSGNWGLLDQVAALEWVKRNIGQFGGDPAKVTLAGQSGGAACVAALMVCPKAKGLFRHAIVQGAGPQWIRRRLREARGGLASGEAQGEALQKLAGAASIEALRAMSADELLAAAKTAEGPFAGGEQWGPVVDGALLPDDPWTLWNAGAQADVPLLCGANADDGSVFPAPVGVVDVWQYKDWLKTAFPADPDRIAKAFAPRLRDDVPATLRDLFSDALAVEPARFIARAHAARGRKAWLYVFTRVSPGAEKRGLGAFHGAEAGYVFGTVAGPVGHDETDHRLAKRLCDAWAQFVKTGDPNVAESVEWPGYATAEDAWLEAGDELRVVRGYRRGRLDALAEVREKEAAPPK